MRAVSFRSLASEFPNDNPELHDGTVWVCLSPCGPLKAIRRATATEVVAPEPEAEPVRAEPEAEPVRAEAEPEPEAEPVRAEAEPEPEAEPVRAEPEPERVEEPEAEAEAEDPFEHLVAVLARVALASGSTRAAAVLPPLMNGEVVEEAAIGTSSAELLVARGWLEKLGRGFALSAERAAVAGAWRRVLRGESSDLGECEGTLDGWMAELVSEITGAPSRRDELRRALRGHGVAAFGLLAA